MTEISALTDKIQSYLLGLSPRAVETLVRKLEKARASGSADPHLEIILQASIGLMRRPDFDDGKPNGLLRKAQIQRMFFAPLEEFLINEALPNKQEGRVYRPALEKVWGWLGRDVLPGDIKQVLLAAENDKVSDERVDALVQALRTRSVDAIGSALDRSKMSEKEHRRLAVEMGGDRGISELKDVYKIFEAEKWLLPLLRTVPETLNPNRFKSDNDILKVVDQCTTRYPDHVPVVAAALLERADKPAALCTFASRLARTDDPKAISESRFAPFVDVVLSEAERLNVLALDHRNHNPDPVAFSQALSEYHDLVRGVELDMDLSQAGKWHKRMAETKRVISEAVARELGNAHSAVRRALQVPKFGADGTFKVDQTAVDEAVRALRVVVMVKNAPDTFAVNDLGKRTRQAVEQTLEIVTRALINDVPSTGGQQRDAHLAAVDVAIMLSEIYYGADYAAQLRRSRQTAVNKAKEADAKAARKARPPEARLVASALRG